MVLSTMENESDKKAMQYSKTWTTWLYFPDYLCCKYLNFNEQKQSPRGVLWKGDLRNFAKFTGKHLCQSPFFNKVTGLRM